MRVENGQPKPQAQAKSTFEDALKKAQVPAPKPARIATAKAVGLAKPLATKPIAAGARTQKASAALQGKLTERRAEAEVQQPERRRVAEKVATFLIADPESQPNQHAIIVAPQPTQSAPSATPASANVERVTAPTPPEPLVNRVEQLLAHVELLARAEGPALQLQLHEGRASQIEVVRTAKGEVEIRLQARTGAERRGLAAQATQLKASLAERGVRVRSVNVR